MKKGQIKKVYSSEFIFQTESQKMWAEMYMKDCDPSAVPLGTACGVVNPLLNTSELSHLISSTYSSPPLLTGLVFVKCPALRHWPTASLCFLLVCVCKGVCVCTVEESQETLATQMAGNRLGEYKRKKLSAAAAPNSTPPVQAHTHTNNKYALADK